MAKPINRIYPNCHFIHQPFSVAIKPRNDGEPFCVISPDFPECNTIGDTLEDALAKIKAAIIDHIVAVWESGQTIPPAIHQNQIYPGFEDCTWNAVQVSSEHYKLHYFTQLATIRRAMIDCEVRKKPLQLFDGDGKTTLSEYLELDTWTPEQAACLVSGFMPETFVEFPSEGKNPYLYPTALSLSHMQLQNRNAVLNGVENGTNLTCDGLSPFENRKRVLQLWNSRLNPPTQVTARDFVAWCKAKDIDTTWLATVEINLHSDIPAKLYGEGCSVEQKNETTLTRYLELETWTPVEAALLVSGLQPHDGCTEIPSDMALMGLDQSAVMPNEDPFHNARRVLKLWSSRVNPPTLTPREFVAWCKTKNIDTTWLTEIDSKQNAPAAKVEAVPTSMHGPITQNKLRRNTLDPAIDKAINKASSHELAAVYLELKELALTGEKPFSGALDGDALCYTNDNNKPDKLTKDALGKRLKKRRQTPQTAVN